MKPSNSNNIVIRVPALTTYRTDGKGIMGRQSANESFLKAWMRYTHYDEYFCLARFKNEAEVFPELAIPYLKQRNQIKKQQGESERPIPVFRWIMQRQIHRVKDQGGTLYVPGPQVADMAWIRRRDPHCQDHDFSIVGMTHTTCEIPIQQGLAEMLKAPVYPWDAQICPSHSVRVMVERLLDDEQQWLTERCGAKPIPRPQLPVIPIGIHCDEYDVTPTLRQTRRQALRNEWGIASDEVALLFMGRLDLLTKANLLPLLDALPIVSQKLKPEGIRLVLVIAGWYASDFHQKVIEAALEMIKPFVKVVVADGRDPKIRQGVWQAVDLFCSPVDNIQETFGLTPIEAMASGLPAIVTDYDGYRESVRDGEDGFRITTWQPPEGAGRDLMNQHADFEDSYPNYAGRSSHMVGVDMGQMIQAICNLAQQPALRQRMGESGRQRAKQVYDWSVVMPQYITLFDSLRAIREATAQGIRPVAQAVGHPSHRDPFHSFSHYSSHTVKRTTLVRLGPLAEAAQTETRSLQVLEQQLSRPIYKLNGRFDPLQPELLKTLMQLLHRTSQTTVEALQQTIQAPSLAVMMGQLCWLQKVGLVQLG